jgi:hypothetical protein
VSVAYPGIPQRFGHQALAYHVYADQVYMRLGDRRTKSVFAGIAGGARLSGGGLGTRARSRICAIRSQLALLDHESSSLPNCSMISASSACTDEDLNIDKGRVRRSVGYRRKNASRHRKSRS